MRTIIQFGDVLLVISICLGRAPSHNTINHKLMPFPQQIAPTIIRPCLRQFSFKFCDHRSPLPHPSFFSRNRTSLACTSAWIWCKILQLQQAQAHKQNLAKAQAHKQDIATSTACLLKGNAKACPAWLQSAWNQPGLDPESCERGGIRQLNDKD